MGSDESSKKARERALRDTLYRLANVAGVRRNGEDLTAIEASNESRIGAVIRLAFSDGSRYSIVVMEMEAPRHGC